MQQQGNMRWLLSRQRNEDETKANTSAPKQQIKIAARFVSRSGAQNYINFPEVRWTCGRHENSKYEVLIDTLDHTEGENKCYVLALSHRWI